MPTTTGFLAHYDRFQLRKVQVPDNIKVPRIAPHLVEWFADLERQLAAEANDDDRRLKLNEYFPINRKLDFRQNLLMIKRRSLQVGHPLRALELWERFYWNGNRDPDDYRLKTITHAVRCLVAGEYDRRLFVHLAQKLLGDKYMVVRIKPVDELYEVFDEVEAVYDAWARIRQGLRYSRVRVLRRHYNRVYTYGKALGVLRLAARQDARDVYRTVLKEDLRMRREERATREQVARQLKEEVPQELADEEQVRQELAQLSQVEEEEDDDDDMEVDDKEDVDGEDDEDGEDGEYVDLDDDDDEDDLEEVDEPVAAVEVKEEVKVEVKDEVEVVDNDETEINDAINSTINSTVNSTVKTEVVDIDDDEADVSIIDVNSTPKPSKKPTKPTKAKTTTEKTKTEKTKPVKVKLERPKTPKPKSEKTKAPKVEKTKVKKTKGDKKPTTPKKPKKLSRIPASLKMDLVGMEEDTVDLTSPRRTRRNR